MLDFRGYDNADLGIALMRDGNGTRSVETVMRYRGAAMAEFMRALKTLQALQAEARATADQPVPARRRARPPASKRTELEQMRQRNRSTPSPRPRCPPSSRATTRRINSAPPITPHPHAERNQPRKVG